MRIAFRKETLFRADIPAVFRNDGKVGRIQQHGMERLAADSRMEIAAEADACQTRKRVLRASLVKLYAVCHAVRAFAQCGKGKPFPAAGVEQVRRGIFRKNDAPPDMREMLHFRGVIAHFDTVHQPADDRRADGAVFVGKFRG